MGDKLSYICPNCGKPFKTERALQIHVGWEKRLEKLGKKKESARNPDPDVLDAAVEAQRPSADGMSSDVMLKAMRMLREGSDPIDVMSTLDITISQMKGILREYRELIGILPSRSSSAADGFIYLARVFGEHIRERCDYYNDETGVCNYYTVYDVDPEFRSNHPGLLKTVSGKYRYVVRDHPEVCVLCRRGWRREA